MPDIIHQKIVTTSEQVHKLLNKEKFEEARRIVNDLIDDVSKLDEKNRLYYLANAYGILIDIGDESRSKDDLERAVFFMKQNEELLSEGNWRASFYYNLGNACNGLARHYYYNHQGVHSLEINRKYFHDPIKYYWIAFNAATASESELIVQVAINLGNALVTVGRIVEALQFWDIILGNYPDYPQALLSKADNLNYMILLTNCSLSVSLCVQIYYCYDQALKTGSLPLSYEKHCEAQKGKVLTVIQSYGFNLGKIEAELKETEKEFQNLSMFRKFSLENFLTLNEHAIYCKCIATEKDNLQIGVEHGLFKDSRVPKLELLLNRLKAEFAFARWCFYKSEFTVNEVELDTGFSDLLDGEVISGNAELLRSSFRICYGILDKIALGICKLFNIPFKKVHFETFWDDSKVFEKINNHRNIHINALYSIACDLNTKTGELKQYKNWRNKIEHNLLVIKDNIFEEPDPFKIFEDKDFVSAVSIHDFRFKTRHLLQLTRAAIFSYAYCIRLELIKPLDNGDDAKGFPIRFK